MQGGFFVAKTAQFKSQSMINKKFLKNFKKSVDKFKLVCYYIEVVNDNTRD